MIKFMDRSIWYYIKRPMFTCGLICHSSSVRIYSLFVMDLIEQDLIEYKQPKQPQRSWSSYREWTIKGTNQQIEHANVSYYINRLLRKKKQDVENKEQETRIKHNMTLAIQAMKTNLEGDDK